MKNTIIVSAITSAAMVALIFFTMHLFKCESCDSKSNCGKETTECRASKKCKKDGSCTDDKKCCSNKKKCEKECCSKAIQTRKCCKKDNKEMETEKENIIKIKEEE